AQRQGVLDEELDRQAALGRLEPGPPDRLVHEINAGDLVAAGGEEQGGIAGAAAGIEDRAGDPVGGGDERPLWPADVPGGLPGVGVLKGGAVGEGAHGGLLRGCGGTIYLAARPRPILSRRARHLPGRVQASRTEPAASARVGTGPR